MRRLILLLVASLPLFATPPTVSNITTDGLSHSVVRLTFDVSGTFNDMRLRYIVSPGTCTGGSGGHIQTNGSGVIHYTSGFTDVLAGLSPNTTYNICPEVTNDGGSTWSSGIGTTITTLSLPSIHPAIPIAPQTFNTDYPDMGTGFVDCSVGTSSTGYCSKTVTNETELQAAVDDAQYNQGWRGTVIYIPAGTTLKPTILYFNPLAADSVQWQPTDVSVAGNTIVHTAHGLTEGQQIQFGKQYGSNSSLPGVSNSCSGMNIGFIEGQVYKVAYVDADHFGLYCPDGVTRMIFTSQGSTDHYFLYVSFPRKLKQIIIRTSTPDSELPPEHTRITPAWASKMATLMNPVSNFGDTTKNWIIFGDGDDGDQRMTGNIRLGPGLNITTEDAPESHLSFDPQVWYRLIGQGVWNSNITFDRDWIHGAGTPNRLSSTSGSVSFVWDGSFNAIVDSYLSDLVYPRPTSSISPSITDSRHVALSAGTMHVGGQTLSLPAETITFSGTPSGAGYGLVYFDLLSSNALTVAPPAGVTVSCSPAACASASPGANSGGCDWSTGWPKDAYGAPSVGGIACFNMAGSSVTTIDHADITSSRWMTDTDQFMIGGRGPGPWKFANNTVDSPTLWHHDEGAGDTRIRADYDYRRNTFSCGLSRLLGSSTSDGYSYWLRQPLEWKSGWRISLIGNIFENCWVDRTPASVFVAFTSVAGQGIKDVDMQYNTFRHGPGITNVPTQSGNAKQTLPPERFRFKNNLAYDIGSPTYWSADSDQFAPNGWVFEGLGGGEEDTIVDHNSIVGNIGRNPAIFWVGDTNSEGVSVTNNIFYVSSANEGFAQDGGISGASECWLLKGKAAADCHLTPSYIWSHNLMLSPDADQATVRSWWSGLTNYIPSDMTLANVGWLSMALNDYRLLHNYCSGCGSAGTDGNDVGANINELEAAQGKVSLTGVPEKGLTTTVAHVLFNAPDSQGCPVDWSSTDPNVITSFTRVADTGGARARDITLTGLSTNTLYYYRVNCAVEQPIGRFKTH